MALVTGVSPGVARLRIKICCVTSKRELSWAVSAGASAVGLVSSQLGGTGAISHEAIAAIAKSAPPTVSTVLLTDGTDPDSIADSQRNCRVNALQLCSPLNESGYAALRKMLPGVPLMQVIRVLSRESVDSARSIASHVDALIADSMGVGGELGGTGRVHDWEVTAQIVSEADKPVFLAGGLTPDNVQEAIQRVRPFGVDVCTGVRSGRRIDKMRLLEFCQRALNTRRVAGSSLHARELNGTHESSPRS